MAAAVQGAAQLPLNLTEEKEDAWGGRGPPTVPEGQNQRSSLSWPHAGGQSRPLHGGVLGWEFRARSVSSGRGNQGGLQGGGTP